jgi:hypothetical protein
VNARNGKQHTSVVIQETDVYFLFVRIHCFENVTAILFVVAISGYDQCLVEDRDSVS